MARYTHPSHVDGERDYTIGVFDPKTRIYRKRVARKTNFMEIVKGFGIQATALDGIKEDYPDTKIVIELTDTGETLESDLADWVTNHVHKAEYHYKSGEQYFLSEKYMRSV